MKNQVIKCTTEEQGKLIIDYWKSKGIYTGVRQGRIIDYYYGVINGKFNCYSASYCLDNKCELIELPTSLPSPEHKFKIGDEVLVLDKDGIKKPAIFITYLEKGSGYEIVNPYGIIFESDIKQGDYRLRCCLNCEPIVKDEVTLKKVLTNWAKGRVNLEGNISFDNVRLRDCDLSYNAHDKEYIITYFVETYRSYLYRLDQVKIL